MDKQTELAQPSKNPLDNATIPVILKEDYYKDKFGGYLYIMLAGASVIFMLILLTGYIIASKPQPQYFVTDERNQIFEAAALSDPVYNQAQVRDWAAQIILRLYDLNFVNYSSRIAKSVNLFTPNGYQKYLDSVRNTDLPAIVNGKFVSKVNLCDVVTVDDKSTGVFNIDGQDTYVWTLTLPMHLMYQNKDKHSVVARIILRIQRVSELDYLGGLAISDISVVDRTNINRFSSSDIPICNG